MLSPPCSTWSRARFRYSGKFGAKPLRNSTYVWGFPWLESSQRELADRGNLFIQQCARAVQLQLAAGKYFLWEHPEDLGRTSNGESPASIWQISEVRSLLSEAGSTWAINQCDLGGSSAKPTRLLSNLPAAVPLHMGWPAFGSSGEYAGPLKRCKHGWHEPLVGWQDGQYRTSGAEAYPPPLCQYFANLIISPLRVLSGTDTISRRRMLRLCCPKIMFRSRTRHLWSLFSSSRSPTWQLVPFRAVLSSQELTLRAVLLACASLATRIRFAFRSSPSSCAACFRGAGLLLWRFSSMFRPACTKTFTTMPSPILSLP